MHTILLPITLIIRKRENCICIYKYISVAYICLLMTGKQLLRYFYQSISLAVWRLALSCLCIANYMIYIILPSAQFRSSRGIFYNPSWKRKRQTSACIIDDPPCCAARSHLQNLYCLVTSILGFKWTLLCTNA